MLPALDVALVKFLQPAHLGAYTNRGCDCIVETSTSEDIIMQAYGNVGSDPVKKLSKTTGKPYWELRLCESQRGVDSEPTWYSVRVMRDVDLKLAKGDFVKVTGKLKADFYLSREGKPTGTLLILAFEAAKIAKPVAASAESASA
ncbi:single stranded DNA-binding domain-containing protein [Trinickia dabaoshanensis]|nr:single-strand-binding protein/primosomal replication protein n [Trinickia dabaoshanensis]